MCGQARASAVSVQPTCELCSIQFDAFIYYITYISVSRFYKKCDMYLSVRLGTHMCAPAVLPSHLVVNVTAHPCNFLLDLLNVNSRPQR